ncbi:MAG: S41 family peptidase [Polyangiaceae bacterium]
MTTPKRAAVTLAVAGAFLGAPRLVAAGDFDTAGNFQPSADAVAFVDFGDGFDPEEDRFVPADVEPLCLEPAFTVEEGPALTGDRYLHIQSDILNGCAERLLVEVPKVAASYTASLWVRHGGVDAQMTVVFPEPAEGEPAREIVVAKLAPTGRVTSDGWVELASNAFPVDGKGAEAVYLRVYDYDSVGSDIDALELHPDDAPYVDEVACRGVGDPVCGEESVCIHRKCRLGRLGVPPLPSDALRDSMVDMMRSQLEIFFGGRKTRLEDLPVALAKLETLRNAKTAWAFWNGWGHANRLLHDWHTSASSAFGNVDRTRTLSACFIEGDADLSQTVWPKHPVYHDLLVSHAGAENNAGLRQGDRLVAVDGLHPFEWVQSLREVEWGFWQACDSDVYAEFAERMRNLITKYAETFSVIHCDALAGTCDDVPETIRVEDLPQGGGQVRCDNRPAYHLADSPGSNHGVGFNFYSGLVLESNPQEAIYSLLWDTLYGGGDPNGYVNGNIKAAYDVFRQNARGVILDHRAGNGGTLDAAELVTTLVRPPEQVLVFTSPIEFGGWNGPTNPLEGVAIFDAFKSSAAMNAGASNYDPDLPVALLIHRDGSASDFMPYAMKGAPKTRLFGPGPTAGAFSTYYNFSYWGGISFQMASGDSIGADGLPTIGYGVVPDEIVLPKQSDLVVGKDTIFEAALAWVRTELKP